MAYCKVCVRRGVHRDGGRLGLCWQHHKRTCEKCGKPSAGEVLCVSCERNPGLQGKRVLEAAETRAANHVMADPRRDDGELLWEAKFKAHETVECFFQVLFRLKDAFSLFGRKPPEEGQHAGQFKEAA